MVAETPIKISHLKRKAKSSKCKRTIAAVSRIKGQVIGFRVLEAKGADLNTNHLTCGQSQLWKTDAFIKSNLKESLNTHIHTSVLTKGMGRQQRNANGGWLACGSGSTFRGWGRWVGGFGFLVWIFFFFYCSDFL